MKISQKGLDLIKKFEGFKSKPYLCSAGVPTIGYGSTFYEDGKKVTLKDLPITESRAEALLRFTIEKTFEPIIKKYIKVSLTQGQFDALVSFVYNIGAGGLWSASKNAPTTICKLINASQFDEAAEQFPRWNKASGKELTGLTNRRNEEKGLFLA